MIDLKRVEDWLNMFSFSYDNFQHSWRDGATSNAIEHIAAKTGLFPLFWISSSYMGISMQGGSRGLSMPFVKALKRTGSIEKVL